MAVNDFAIGMEDRSVPTFVEARRVAIHAFVVYSVQRNIDNTTIGKELGSSNWVEKVIVLDDGITWWIADDPSGQKFAVGISDADSKFFLKKNK